MIDGRQPLQASTNLLFGRSFRCTQPTVTLDRIQLAALAARLTGTRLAARAQHSHLSSYVVERFALAAPSLRI